MRKDIVNSRLLHYVLLVLSLSAATVGGLVLLGCVPADAQDVTVVNPEQRHGPEESSSTEARRTRRSPVNLAATWKDNP